MAFQCDTQFAAFLRNTARSAVIAESAPAVNFLLEERIPDLREKTFLTKKPDPAQTAWDIHSWWETFGNYYGDRVARPLGRALEISTFAAENSVNHLAIESHQDMVRLESIKSLHHIFPGDFDSPAELAEELHNLVHSKKPGQGGTFSDDRLSRLETWLNELNLRREARPHFAAPFDEIVALLSTPDWATQLRNVLGLSHFSGSAAKPLPVVLCRYNLSRVERAARKARVSAWAAVPTILEAGGAAGPGPAFFPFPKAASASSKFGFGVAVDLSQTDKLNFNSELLHFRLDYTLDDFVMVGEITDEVSNAQLASARQRHFNLLDQDFQHRSDVP